MKIVGSISTCFEIHSRYGAENSAHVAGMKHLILSFMKSLKALRLSNTVRGWIFREYTSLVDMGILDITARLCTERSCRQRVSCPSLA